MATQNGQTHFKNFAANAPKFLKCVWPFWEVMYEKVDIFSREHLYESQGADGLKTS